MKSTMLNRALDLRDPATGNRKGFICEIPNENLVIAAVTRWALTSLNGTFFSFCSGKCVDKVSKSTMPAEELLVGAALSNFSIYQDKDMVGLRQEAHSVCNQYTRLRSKQKQKMENQKRGGLRGV